MPNLFTSFSALLFAASQEACTFVTTSPDGLPECKPVAATGGSGGANGAGGTANGVGGEPLSGEEWTVATGNLAGLDSDCGNMGIVVAKPGENMLIAGIAKQGLWSSVDGGNSWEQLGTGADSDPIIDKNRPAAIVFDPDNSNVFWEAGIYGEGVFRTDDNGQTFKRQGEIMHIDLVSIDFTDPDRRTLLAGGHEQAQTLNLSIDGGMTWKSVGEQLPPSTNCTSPLIIDSSTFLVGCGGYGGGFAGIYRSDDGGETWSEAAKSGGGGEPLVTRKGEIFWTDPYPGGLSRSLDGGETWEKLASASAFALGTAPIELPDGRIAVLANSVVLVSADQGETWRVATAALPFQDGRGLAYSEAEKAFFTWRLTCTSGPLHEDAIMRANFDYEAN